MIDHKVYKNEALHYRDEALQYKNKPLQYRNEIVAISDEILKIKSMQPFTVKKCNVSSDKVL